MGEQQRKYQREWYKRQGKARSYGFKKMAMTIQNDGKCACRFCGETDLAVLSFDHIHNNGCQSRIEGEKTGCLLAAEIVKSGKKRDDLQVLCMNCQYRKREYGDDFTKWIEERNKWDEKVNNWIDYNKDRDNRRLSIDDERKIKRLLMRVGHKRGACAAIARKFNIPPYACSEFLNPTIKKQRKRIHFYRIKSIDFFGLPWKTELDLPGYAKSDQLERS